MASVGSAAAASAAEVVAGAAVVVVALVPALVFLVWSAALGAAFFRLDLCSGP